MTVRLIVSPSEQVYSGVTYLFAAAMMMVSALVTLWPQLPADEQYWAGFVALIVALLVWFAAMGRLYIADGMRQLTSQQRMVMGGVAIVAFLLPSLLLDRWAPLAGLLILHVPACLGLVSPWGFAQAYLLNGLSLIVASNELPEFTALLAWGSWLLLLCLTVCAEHYLHTFRRHPHNMAGKPIVPLARGLERFLLAAVITLPFALMTPAMEPLRRQPLHPAVNEPDLVQVTHPLADPSSPNWIYAILQLISAVILIPILFVLVRFFRKRRGEAVLAEDGISMGMPVIRPLAHRRPKRRPPSTIRDQIAALYEQMSEALKNFDLGRNPELTATEYGERLAKSGIVPKDLCEELTRQFTLARYAPEEPQHEDVERFRNLVRRVLAVSQRGDH